MLPELVKITGDLSFLQMNTWQLIFFTLPNLPLISKTLRHFRDQKIVQSIKKKCTSLLSIGSQIVLSCTAITMCNYLQVSAGTWCLLSSQVLWPAGT